MRHMLRLDQNKKKFNVIFINKGKINFWSMVLFIIRNIFVIQFIKK